jgi:hypothetical protein
MKVVVRTAPAGIESFWLWDDEREQLTIWVNEDLDPLTRRRYIRQAEQEQRIDPKRRRRLAPPLIIAGAHRFVWRHKAGSAVTAAGAAAAITVGTIALSPAPPGSQDISTVARGPSVAVAPVTPGRSPGKPSQHSDRPTSAGAPQEARPAEPLSAPVGASALPSQRPVVPRHPLRPLREQHPIRKAVPHLPVRPRGLLGHVDGLLRDVGVPPLRLRRSLPPRLLPVVPSAHASP